MLLDIFSLYALTFNGYSFFFLYLLLRFSDDWITLFTSLLYFVKWSIIYEICWWFCSFTLFIYSSFSYLFFYWVSRSFWYSFASFCDLKYDEDGALKDDSCFLLTNGWGKDLYNWSILSFSKRTKNLLLSFSLLNYRLLLALSLSDMLWS